MKYDRPKWRIRPAYQQTPDAATEEQRFLVQFLEEWAGGRHHLYGHLEEFSTGVRYLIGKGLATFDGSELTRLVQLAHQLLVRVEVEPASAQRLALILHRRKESGTVYERHPNIVEAFGYAVDRERVKDALPAGRVVP